MQYYHGNSHKKPYFEGWYFKHQVGDKVFAVIPGICKDSSRDAYGFIQILTNQESFWFTYPMSQVKIDRRHLWICIGNSIFSEHGISLCIERKDFVMKGRITYGNLTPLRYSIMGPFSLLPFMECNHGVISMHHNIWGKMRIKNHFIKFDGGYGYIETDWGKSFPQHYFWSQHQEDSENSIMLAVANIPIGRITFTGTICAIRINGKEYRIATYLGAKVLIYTSERIMIQQGDMVLKVSFQREAGIGHGLKAPICGEMNSSIREHIDGKTRFCLWNQGKKCFDWKTRRAVVEKKDAES